MYLRKTKRKRTEVSFEDSLSFDSEGNELHLEDVLGTDDDIVTKPIEEELDKYMMYQEVSKLEDRDREIIELRYGLNGKKEMTQKEVTSRLSDNFCIISLLKLSLAQLLNIQSDIFTLPFSKSFVSKLLIEILYFRTISLIILSKLLSFFSSQTIV